MSALSDALTDAKNGRSESIDAIQQRARDAGYPLHRATIAKYLSDGVAQHPSEQTIQGLAAGFMLPAQQIRQLLALPAGEPGPWVPPSESVRLDREQRAVLDALVKIMARGGAADDGITPSGQQSDGGEVPNREVTAVQGDGNGLGELERMATATADSPFSQEGVPRRASLESEDHAAAQQPSNERARP